MTQGISQLSGLNGGITNLIANHNPQQEQILTSSQRLVSKYKNILGIQPENGSMGGMGGMHTAYNHC
jgi:hypothetical protein